MIEGGRVLIVEDDVLIGQDLHERLTRMGIKADGPIRTGGLAVESVADTQPDLILMDIHLKGEMDGIEAARLIRARFDIPVIFLTAYSDERTIQRAASIAPFGYLLKPVSDAHLRATIPMVLERHRAERCAKDAAQAREKILYEAAMRDPLTGLWNRRAILEILEKEAARADRERRAVTVLMIDVDRFKNINDTYGHLIGDVVLREVAHRMTHVMRPYDELGRYGGDEFLFVALEERAHAARLAERLANAVANPSIAAGAGSIAVSISVGICAMPVGAAPDAMALLDEADRALYAVKKERRAVALIRSKE